MWKFIFGFIWDAIVGKDVRPGKAIKDHKSRVVMAVVFFLSVAYNVHVTTRLNTWYQAYRILEAKYVAQKAKVAELEKSNKTLTDVVTKHITHTLKDPPPSRPKQ